MAAVMIELKNITVRYGNAVVVDTLSATATPGQLIALIGPNGSGKSSLLKAAAGLLPHEGSSSLPTGRKERAKHLSYLSQNCTAPDGRKVEDIIGLGRSPFLGPLSKLSKTDQSAIEAAAKACETYQYFGRTFGTLSGGEQMRVHLSRALATDTPVLLADEPTTALDPYYQISLLSILRQSADTGKTIIVALHDLKLAERFADRIWIMQAGRLVANEPAKTALSDTILRDVFRVTSSGDILS
jgi:iron complex transport system ATP-binding protein